jgi:hypothetical protein
LVPDALNRAGDHRGLDRKTPVTFDDSYRIDLNGCWIWIGGRNHRYGCYNIGGRGYRAHRYAWERVYGPVPDGMYVCHHCDTPLCVNPEHLFVGTQRDNIRDASAKGRMTAGHLGKTLSDEAKAKLSAVNKGKILTPEHRAKIRAALQGRVVSPEAIARSSAARRGIPHGPTSPETRAKISAIVTAWHAAHQDISPKHDPATGRFIRGE